MSSSDVGVIKIRNENSKELSATIYYQKPFIMEITNCENPFDLKISYDEISYRTIKCYHQNLKNATKGNYYGPFPISEFEFNLEVDCYFPEESFPEMAKWCEYATNIQKYVVTESASTQCDLSLAPTRKQEAIEPPSTSTSESLARSLPDPNSSNSESQGSTQLDPKVGIIKLKTCELDKQLGEKDVRYVMPLEKEIEKCYRAFPLEFFGNDGSYIIFPCFTSKSQNFPSGTNHEVYTIQLITPNGSVPLMKCHIPHVQVLLDTQNLLEEMLRHETSLDDSSDITEHTIGRCNYTIYKKNGTKEDELFDYAVPSQNDIENGRNQLQLHIFNDEKLTRVPVYIGNFKSFDRKKYIGPYLIEINQTDGTRGWLNCYFEKGSIFHKNEDAIQHRVEKLYLERDKFESQKNALLGTDGGRNITDVKYFEKNGFRLVQVLRKIEEYDFTGNVLSGSEI